ncbi:glycosyltransferase family 2 protein [Campylobacter sp. JMF_06 NA1]|uniref:glycosyltransferase family 2 protein n=1 Tax=Campylobacter sp. JMF_06 NA1 TaxID=2983823 RepID=UPI0022E9C1F0|nr:glycosyltransferase family 2 protein [Campylobacter sp. JMF_06 NA1]MDA3077966.1 glycosyltransferase family 2 protein [Campylobacter sp. JMF_06 NA1]
MNENQLISIVIPVYNVEKYLKECLDSVTNQTYKNLEIILIDDGSTDSSGKMCDEFIKKDNRIRVIHKQNGGLSSARNAGLDVMQGEYLAFVDSDDMIDETYIETLYDMIKKYNTKISMVSFEKFTDTEYIQEIKQQNLNNKTIQAFNIEEFFKNYLISKTNFHNFNWRCLYHKSIFKNLRFPIGILFEDVAIYFDVFSNQDTMYISNKKLYFYRQNRPGAITHSINKKYFAVLEVYKNFTDNIVKKYPNLKKEANLKMCISNLMLAKMVMKDKSNEFKYKLDEYHKYIYENLNILFALKSNKKIAFQLILFYINPKIFEVLFSFTKRI